MLLRKTCQLAAAGTPAGEDSLKKLDSSMKRNTALIRKLRALSEESRQSVLDDIAKTNQSKVGPAGGEGDGPGVGRRAGRRAANATQEEARCSA
jgi:hypothetical protein